MYFIDRLQQWSRTNQRALLEIVAQRRWIRLIRRERDIKGKELAKMMGLSAARISVMEKDEASGALTLKMMQRAANALDCEFVYLLVPKSSLKDFDENEKPKVRLKNIAS